MAALEAATQPSRFRATKDPLLAGWPGQARPRRLGCISENHSFLRELQPHLAVVLALLGPVLAHLHEQEQMHAAAEDLLQLRARELADLLDRGAALAQHDRLLPVALDVDRLVDLDRAVGALFPL